MADVTSWNEIGQLVLAAGALGTAAYGIMDGLKVFPKVSSFGFSELKNQLNKFAPIFEVAYGNDYERVLKLYYSKDRASDAFMAELRQSVRLGLSNLDQARIYRLLESLDLPGTDLQALLQSVADDVASGTALDQQKATNIARVEAVVLSRLEAAAAASENKFKGAMRLSAMGVALLLTVGSAGVINIYRYVNDIATGFDGVLFGYAVLAGLVAVPIAPIAKDVASGIQAATRILRTRG